MSDYLITQLDNVRCVLQAVTCGLFCIMLLTLFCWFFGTLESDEELIKTCKKALIRILALMAVFGILLAFLPTTENAFHLISN